MRDRVLASALAGAVTVASAAEPAPAAFERCAACHEHAAAPGTAPVGPPLQGLAGRRAGSVPGFRYSGPLARSGVVWTAQTLAAFLHDPQAVVPGNRMAFSGIEDEAELRALVAYLLNAP